MKSIFYQYKRRESLLKKYIKMCLHELALKRYIRSINKSEIKIKKLKVKLECEEYVLKRIKWETRRFMGEK